MESEILGPTWNLTPQGVEFITSGSTIKDKQTLLKKALDTDLKEIGASVLSKEISKSTLKEVVLQIQKVRNISAPKANENSQAAPRMLKLILTDGDTYIQAIEIDNISSLSLDKTAPGSKLLVKSAPISSGYLLLNPKNCTFLGGKVLALYEKWELAKSVYNYNRTNRTTTDGAPLWVNFGSKVSQEPTYDNFKSLDNKIKDTAKENSDFELQRQGAIADATSGAVRKVFGGGTKQGAINNTNLTTKRNDSQPKETGFNRNNNHDRNKKFTKNFLEETDVDDKPQKPLERVSLFDFLEDKLPVQTVQPPPPVRNFNNDFKQNQFYQPQTQNSNYKGRNPRPQNPPQNRNNYQKFDNRENQSKPFENNHQRSYNQYQPDVNKSKPLDNNYYPQSERKFHQQPREEKKTFNNYEDKGKKSQPPPPPPEKTEVAELTGNVEKMSINSQFASRSLRQHLNLGSAKKTETFDGRSTQNVTKNWKVGEECMAKYWEDNKHYNALITAVTEKTCVVKFRGYDNIEEILKTDCIPVNEFKRPQGSMEFRRKPTRKQ